MIPVSRPYPLTRDAFWLNPVSPHIPSTFDRTFARSRTASDVPLSGAIPVHGVPHASMFGNQTPEADRPESRTSMVCKSLELFGRVGKATGSRRKSPFPGIKDERPGRSTPQPPLASGASIHTLQPERRRNVAQVRRKGPKLRDFLAPKISSTRCDNLLTMAVDRSDRAGL